MGHWTPLEWLALVEYELLLFAAVFFLIGALDELAMDGVWAWLRLTGTARTERIVRDDARERPLAGPAAVLIPAWHEAQIIEFTIAHALAAWPQRRAAGRGRHGRSGSARRARQRDRLRR